uniref:Uncharacterized protein n=1 Tax=Triticum urartu TaxID=4572 RepID=A0A8R7PVM6_TRIUA
MRARIRRSTGSRRVADGRRFLFAVTVAPCRSHSWPWRPGFTSNLGASPPPTRLAPHPTPSNEEEQPVPPPPSSPTTPSSGPSLLLLLLLSSVHGFPKQ